jgi:hypothetical protein
MNILHGRGFKKILISLMLLLLPPLSPKTLDTHHLIIIGLIRCMRSWRTLRGIRFGNWLTRLWPLVLRVFFFALHGFQTWILLGVGWIGSPLLGLASFWGLLWCLGPPADSRVLLNPLPRQCMLLQLVVSLSSIGLHTP